MLQQSDERKSPETGFVAQPNSSKGNMSMADW